MSAAYPYRAGYPGADAIGSGVDAVAELDALLARVGPGRIAAFVADADPGKRARLVETLLDGAADDPADRRRFLEIVARQGGGGPTGP